MKRRFRLGKSLLTLVMVLALAASMVVPALAAESGYISASGVASEHKVTDEECVYVSDNDYAVFNDDDDWANYTFGTNIVPTGAIINGIEVRLEAQDYSFLTSRTLTVSLYSGSTQRGNSKNTGSLTTSDKTYTLGSASDTWDYSSWTAADINTTNFQVRVSSPNGSGHCYLDHLQIKVTYTMPSVTVSYNAQGGTPTPTSQNVTLGSAYGTLPTVTKTGYTFNGWFTAASGGSKVTATTTVTNASAHTLYAQWTPVTVAVSFDAQGGTPSPSNINVTFGSAYGTLPTVTKTGYTFNGWFTAASGGSKVTATTTVTNASAHTLYAKWTPVTVTVSFNVRGGTPSPSDMNVAFGSAYGTLPAVTKTGYNFNGWFTAASGGSQVTDTTTVTNVSAHTLYARWTINRYTVSYDANGGTGDVPATDATVKYGASVTVLGNTGETPLAKTGYTFNGWNTAANGSGTGYAEDATFSMPAGNVTLYAVWTVNRYTVSYDGNTNTSGTAPASVTQNYDTTVTVSGQGSLVKTGYSFDGWNTEADGSGTDYTSGQTFPMPLGGLTLYAQWTINSYTVSYSANGGIGDVPAGDTKVVYGTEVTVLGNTGETPLAKTGYTFNGWNTAANGSGTGYAEDATFSMPAGNVTLYAVWTVNRYTVSYDGNTSTGGTAPASVTQNYNTTVAVSGQGSLVKTGYSFDGWNTAADGSGTDYTSGQTFPMPLGGQTLYAQWKINSYAVSYNGNGGTGDVPAEGALVEYGTSVTVLGNASETPLEMTGYTFNGWNTAADGTGTGYAAGAKFNMPAGNVTLYAVWTINSYTVSYDGNTNTGGEAPDSVTQDYDTAVTVSEPGTLVKTGYSFAGWNTAANGTGTPYTGNGTETITLGTENVTLYAQWTINRYTVSYNDNGGTGDLPAEDAEVVYGIEVTVLGNEGKPPLTKTGHTFNGWNTAANGSGTGYAADETFSMPAGDVTLYAVWTVNRYKVSYDGNTSTGGMAPGSVTEDYDKTMTVSGPGSLVKTGYSFADWNTAADGSGTDYTSGQTFPMPLGGLTLYAQWTINRYTVSYNANGGTGDVPTDDAEVIYGTEVTVLRNEGEPPLTKTGYTFNGWNTAADGTGTGYAAGAKFNMPAGNVTLYAVWTINRYTVSYDGNKSTGGEAPDSVTQDYDTAVTVSGPGALEKTGYSFAGWNTKAEGTGTPYIGDGTETITLGTENVTLYAQWTINSYILSYNGNGGIGDVPADDADVIYDTDVIVLGNTGETPLAKTGYTFSGWNTAANESGTGYAVDETFNMPAGNVTLYAVWTINRYDVTWDVDGTTTIESYQHGATPSFSGSTDKAADAQYTYTFTGWSSEIAPVTGAVTYKAQYSRVVNKYTVTFKNHDGTTLSTQSVPYGSGATAPSVSSGWTSGQYMVVFVGWDVPFDNITGDLTVTVRYNAVPIEDDDDTGVLGEEDEPIDFVDVNEDDWFYDAVQYVVTAGLFGGTSDTTFEPGTAMTRGMLVTVLYRLEGSPAVTAENPFTDVEAGKYYTDAVIWAADNGIVLGYDGKFNPNAAITREQMAVILYNYAVYKGYSISLGSLDGFIDASQISDYAVEAMQWATGAQLLRGKGTTATVAPQDTATRAEVAQILMRFVEYFVN